MYREHWVHDTFRLNNAVDFRFRWTLLAGGAMSHNHSTGVDVMSHLSPSSRRSRHLALQSISVLSFTVRFSRVNRLDVGIGQVLESDQILCNFALECDYLVIEEESKFSFILVEV